MNPRRADAARPRVLVVGTDAATYGLLAEWLADAGCDAASDVHADAGGWSLIVADVPFPRSDAASLQALRARHAGVPILAMSATFLPGVERSGEAARGLGVSCVLAKPLGRDMLVGAVLHLIERQA